MSSNLSEPGPSEELRFDRAEPAAAGAAAACSACGRPFGAEYFLLNGAVACGACCAAVEQALRRRAGAGLFFKALLFGCVAALVCAIGWALIRHLTGYELGIVAVVVGVAVGGAVRKGSGGRGGVAFQLIAVLLTYGTVSASLVPDLFAAMARIGEERAAVGGAPDPDLPAAASEPASSPATAPAEDGRDDPITAAEVALALAALGFLILSMPVLLAIESPLFGLIMAFSLFEAWRVNRRARPQISGPYAITEVRPPAAPPA